ncbi:ABC transporter ATP-binding protein [Ruminococcus flavefaciens]|uniref:ABC transporter ATP-binding protein n=1 Tax=Ruminococcus flavefaciens TaxID=1265 RepID=UPI0004B865BC|nr:ABC transporter ATP-binding protein [Ruminococcus flavefaciens]
MKSILEFDNVSKSFDNYGVLNSLSFTIPENKIVGLVGANGAGKTTSIRHMIRYLTPDSGKILYKGNDIYSINDADFPISFIPDVPIYYEELSVMEHLAFVSAMYNTQSKVKSLIDRLEMGKHLDKVPYQLSKGTRQKLSIMCASLRQYELLIADEPFSGLDPQQISNLKDIFKENKDEGKTVLLSTHLLDMVQSLCDYYILIDNGVLMAQGTLDELTANSRWSTIEELYLYLRNKNNDQTSPDESENQEE